MRTLLLFAVALSLAACASSNPETTGTGRALDDLQASLDLSDAQIALVERTVSTPPEPGDDWRLAAAIAPTLTRAQRSQLMAPPERGRMGRPGMNGRPGRGMGGRGGRGGRGGGMDPDAREERRAETLEARNEALGLSDDEGEALDAALMQYRQERRAMGPSGNPAENAAQLTAALSEVLTPAQVELYLIHRGLARELFRNRMMRRRGMR